MTTEAEKEDRNCLATSLIITAALISPMVASFLDGCMINKRYREYLASHQEPEEPILSYRAYVDNYRKEHPIVGRFYGIGRNK